MYVNINRGKGTSSEENRDGKKVIGIKIEVTLIHVIDFIHPENCYGL